MHTCICVKLCAQQNMRTYILTYICACCLFLYRCFCICFSVSARACLSQRIYMPIMLLLACNFYLLLGMYFCLLVRYVPVSKPCACDLFSSYGAGRLFGMYIICVCMCIKDIHEYIHMHMTLSICRHACIQTCMHFLHVCTYGRFWRTRKDLFHARHSQIVGLLRLWRGCEECNNNCKELCQGCGDSVWRWSDGQRLQDGRSCLDRACQGGHFDVVKYLCEVGGRELVMATASVSGFGLSGWVCGHVYVAGG
jgi:hypothetical protein